MIDFLKKVLINHWHRKLMALISSITLWIVVNHSLTAGRTLENIPVRIINIPPGLTIEGIQPSGLLSQRVKLSIEGKKSSIENISSNDLEVILDATDKSGPWTATITKKNLISLNGELEISDAVQHITPYHLPLQLTRLITEKIPITITPPTGHAPRDYLYLDVWPAHLQLTVSGPQAVIDNLKSQGLTMTFNLDMISKDDLENAAVQKAGGGGDEVSFEVPDAWKKIDVPQISEHPLEIDDPQAGLLRIDFVRSDLHPLGKAIPIHLYFPSDYSTTINPETYATIQGGIVHQNHGLAMIKKNLYVKGVSRLFLQVVQDLLQITVMMAPKSQQRYLEWSLDVVNPRALEDKYVQLLTVDSSHENAAAIPKNKRAEYLRGRFRSYLSNLHLYLNAESPFGLKIELEDNTVHIEEK